MMNRMISILLTVVLVGTVAVVPTSAETIVSTPVELEPIGTGEIVPVAYTSDFDAYSNVVGVLNSDGTKTAYIFASPVDAAQVDSITGLVSPSTESGAEVATGISTTILPVEDATVYSGAPSTNYGSSDSLFVGNSEVLGYARTYMKFDLSTLNTISYKDVLSAWICFEPWSNTTYNQAVVESYLVKSAWTESEITWENRPDYNEELIGNMFYCEPDSTDSLPNCIYITKAVMAWLQGLSNNGVMIKEKDDSLATTFYSSDYPYAVAHPYMVITYSTTSAPLAQGIISGQKYYILNRKTGQYLTSSGAVANSYVGGVDGCTDFMDEMKWKITHSTDGQYTITLNDTGLALEAPNYFWGDVRLNNTGTYNLWVIERNWNGTYRITPPVVSHWGLSLTNTGALQLNSYQCDMDYIDEWTLCPVETGAAELFGFTEEAMGDPSINWKEYATTYGFNSMQQAFNNRNYTAYTHVDASATVGFNALINSDLFFYSGHGICGALHFTDAQGATSDLTVVGQNENSLHVLSQNALARQRFIMLSSCLTGTDYQNDNFVGRMYWLGAHNVIGHFHEIGSEQATVWDTALMTGVLLGRPVDCSMENASLYLEHDDILVGSEEGAPFDFVNEVHWLGDANYRPVQNFVSQSELWSYEYKNIMQLTYKTHYTGQETTEEKAVKDLDGNIKTKEFTLPEQPRGIKYDIYNDSFNGVYWYNTGTNILNCYEPYTENLSIGGTIVNSVSAQAVVNEFLANSGYNVTGYQMESSNSYSKNYTIKYQSPTNSNQRLVFYLKADSSGNAYLVKFIAHNYSE